MSPRRLVRMLLGATLVSTSALAQPPDVPGKLGFEPRLEAVSSDLQTTFHAALIQYDAEIGIMPFDVALRVDRCRFIDGFTYSYENDSWLEEVYELSDECRSDLETDFGNHPEAILYRLETLYGQEQLEAASPYDNPAMRPNWTQGEVARLYELLANAADITGNVFAGNFAMRALDLDARADVRLTAATHQLDEGDRSGAIETIISPFNPVGPTENPYYVAQELVLLARAHARKQVIDLYGPLSQEDYYPRGMVARALRDVGAIDLARDEFTAAAQEPGYGDNPRKDLFDFEMAFGSPAEALAAYDAWRDQGWDVDPLGVNRLTLFVSHPGLSFRARDLLAIVGVLSAISFGALIALIPISFIHYRGLARRVSLGLVADRDGLHLRHAWYGIFTLMLAGILALYAAGSIDFADPQSSAFVLWNLPERIARSFTVEKLLGLALLIPLARVAARQQAVGRNWSVKKCLVVAISVALVFRLPLLWMWVSRPELPSATVDGLVIWRIINDVSNQFGAITALWLLAVVAPVGEEFLFRGVLLQTFSKHVSFALANVVQAGLFASIHADASAIPYLFVVGIVAGILAKRSGGLLAPMAMHATFNLLAGLILLF